MSKSSSKQPIQVSSGSESSFGSFWDSSSEEESAMARAVAFSREEMLRQREAGSSAAFERDRPASTSNRPASATPVIEVIPMTRNQLKVLSDKDWLTKSNPPSSMTKADLDRLRVECDFPPEVITRLPVEDEREDTVSEGWICLYEIYFRGCGL